MLQIGWLNLVLQYSAKYMSGFTFPFTPWGHHGKNQSLPEIRSTDKAVFNLFDRATAMKAGVILFVYNFLSAIFGDLILVAYSINSIKVRMREPRQLSFFHDYLNLC